MTNPQKRSVVIISSLIIIALASIFLKNIFSDKGTKAVITKSGETVCVMKLSKDAEHSLGTNTVKIKDGKAYMSYAECPDKICFSHKPINKKGETIVCLPNRIIVEIE